MTLACAVVPLTGCDQLSALGVTRVEAKSAEPGIDVFLTYQDALLGKDAEAVKEVFGKPKGIFEKPAGDVWMYARWRVEFDPQGRVSRMERDIAATGSGGGAPRPSMALARKAPVAPPTPGAHGNITRISNGGAPVELQSLLQPGKITVVDFYADWCGPCRRVAPLLEKLAGANPDVALVKVDIVKWGTPVTRQHGITSVPNLRVYDRQGNPVGSPTPSFAAVQAYVAQAGR